jgi:hypothetical protein
VRGVSDQFLATLRGSHATVTQAIVCTTYQDGVEPDGTTVPVLAGDVVIDGTADVRSTLDLTVDGTAMWPDAMDDLLAPYGNEIYVRRGVKFGNGSIEWVGLGYFRIESPEQDRVPNGPIQLTGSDRMAAIVEGRLLEPRQYLSTTTCGEAVADLVGDLYPAATIEWDDSTADEPLGRTVAIEEDRYGGLSDIITSRGKIFYWDHRGFLSIKDIPDPGVVVFEVDHGRDGVLISMKRRLDRRGIHNAVVATGEATDDGAPVRGIALDSNPSSPTYFYGRFGQVPRFYSSPLLTTEAQARKAALTMLRKETGLPYTVDFGMIANPALEPYDAVRIRRRDVHTIDTLTVPLIAAQPMTGTTRQQAAQLLGTL